MGRARCGWVVALACSAAALCGVAGCTRSWEGYGRDLGDRCASDTECRSGVCAPGASGARVCTLSCAEGTGCLAGWTCGAGGICGCTPGDERCDAIDDDCDGRIDEAGVCGCGAAEDCDMIDDDCDGLVDEGACGSCVPHVEGCNGRDDDCDGLTDEGATALCASGLVCAEGACRCEAEVRPATDTVDLLLVIDDSSSMAEEQAALARELPTLVRALASGDVDGDGVQEFAPARSLHVGVVTTDMGSGGFSVPTCDRGTFGTRYGDDGILLTRGRTATAGCMATYPPVFELLRGATDPDTFVSDLSCVASVGTSGCGFEQQLEAALKALSPSVPQPWTVPGYVPPIFFESTLGHADRENAGFVREGSTLAIAIVTDEEDCSVANPEVFDMTSSEFPGDLGLRCWMYADQVTHPIDRFVAGTDGHGGLLGLRARPDRVVLSLLAGVPVDAISDPRAVDYEAVLAHPEMQEQLDPDAPATAPRLRPSCNTPLGVAMPPRRLVRVAQALDAAGARVSVGSICQGSYAAPIRALAEDIGDTLTPPTPCR